MEQYSNICSFILFDENGYGCVITGFISNLVLQNVQNVCWEWVAMVLLADL